MAVDSKLGETKLGMGAGSANGTSNGVNGATTTVVAEGTKRTKRTSSLMRSASSLPKVEHSLDEFIARANQTLVDVSQWGNADKDAKEADEKRREQDAQRWKQAETQMRESEAREQSLRRQLDGLQGKLAEAEARVAVALSSSGSFQAVNPAQEKAIDELRTQIDQAQARIKASEAKSTQLAKELELARTEVNRPVAPALAITETVDADEAEQRIKLAEAKAAKALAAARAAAAGLTVSSADLAAIESGLVVPQHTKSRTPWIPIMLAFAGGLGIMFLVWKFALSKNDAPQQPAASATPAQQAQPAVQQQPAPPPEQPTPPKKPTVTPIEDGAAPAPAADDDKKPTVTPIEEPAAVKEEPKAAVKEEPKVEAPKPVAAVKKPAPAPVVKRPVARPTPTPAVKKPAPAGKPAIEDPFAEPKKPAAAPKKPEKPAGGTIVDPFGG